MRKSSIIIILVFIMINSISVSGYIRDEYTECVDDVCNIVTNEVRFIKDSDDTWKNVTDVVQLTDNGGNLRLSCHNSHIELVPYYESDGVIDNVTTLKNKKAKEISKQKTEDFQTIIIKHPEKYYYTHYFTGIKNITEFGYNLPAECRYDMDFIYCDLECGEIRIDLTQARIEQNITVNDKEKNPKKVALVGKDLSVIDPTVSITTARSLISADTYVDEENADSNWGTETQFFVGYYAGDPRYHYRSFIGINFSSLYAISISNAELYLYADDTSLLTTDWYCRSDDWFPEASITYNNMNTYMTESASLIYNDWQQLNDNSWETFNFTSCASGEIGDDDAFVIEILPDSSTQNAHVWRSKDYAATTYDPYFNITYVADTTAPTFSSQSPDTTTDRNPTITIVTGEDAACLWSLADLNYSLMANSTTGNGSTSHTFNYTGFTINANNSYYVSCNDSAGNENDNTDNYDGWVVLNNSLPVAANVTITPSGAGTADALHCIYNYSDTHDAQGGVEYKWFNNTVDISINSDILGSGNTTAGENWTCSVRVNDSTNWGNWSNSSTVTLNDTMNPSISGCTVSSSSVTQNSNVNFCCNVTDDNYIAVGFPVFQIQDPNLAVYNYSYTSSTGDNYCKALSMGLVGSYWFEYGYVQDGNGNENSSTVNLSVLVTSLGGGAGGGGGGGGTTGDCGLKVLEPFTKNINLRGKEGYLTKESFRVYNNESFEQPIYFELESSLKTHCSLSIQSYSLTGMSEVTNFITCEAQAEDYEGKILLFYGSICSDAINVNVKETDIAGFMIFIQNLFKGERGFIFWAALGIIPLATGMIILILAQSSRKVKS
jgi:hypothetical protein